jgi:hypothetical protein
LDEFGVQLSFDPAKFLFAGICYVTTENFVNSASYDPAKFIQNEMI